MLITNFQYIADNPYIGRSYECIINNLFGLKVGRHIIFYRKIKNEKATIEITRILHERMDLKNRIDL
jgi:toxin ParE1/3/4